MIENCPIPDAIIAALKGVVDKIPEKDILEYVKVHKGDLCAGGFQPQKKHINIFRDRLRSMVKNSMIAGAQHPLLDLLRSHDLYQDFTIVLSPEAINHGKESFLAYFGKERFLANLLIDKREDVRQIATDCLNNNGWQDMVLPEKEEAIMDIREGFGPFLEHVGPFVKDEIAEFKEDLLRKDKQIRELSQELNYTRSHLGEENERSGKNESLARQLKDEMRKVKTERDKYKNELKDTRERMVRFESENKTLMEENSDLRNAAEKKEKELSNLRSFFPQDGFSIEAEGFLETAARQSNYPACENVQSLCYLVRTTYLMQCLWILNRNTPHCAGEAQKVFLELTGKASSIREGLGIEPGHSPLYNTAIKWVEGVSSPDELDSTYSYLDPFCEFGILTTDESVNLYAVANRKMDKFYKEYTSAQEGVFREARNPAWRLKRALRDDSPFLLLLDSYNIMHEMKSIFSPYYKKGKGFDENGRKHLLRLVDSIVRKSDKVLVEVYFDSGLSASEEQWSKNVKEVYSGIPGKHSADARIIGELMFDLHERSTVPRCLVSNDRELSNDAFQLEASIMSVHQFSALFFSSIRENGKRLTGENSV